MDHFHALDLIPPFPLERRHRSILKMVQWTLSITQLAIYLASAIMGTKSLENGCNAHTDA